MISDKVKSDIMAMSRDELLAEYKRAKDFVQWGYGNAELKCAYAEYSDMLEKRLKEFTTSEVKEAIMTDNEIRFIEDFTGYRFRGDFTPEALNSGKVVIDRGDMFRIIGADEFVELQAGHLYVRNGIIVRFGYTYVRGEGFFIVADYPCDTVRFGHYLDNDGKQRELKTEMRVPIGMITDGNSTKLLHHIIKELNK